MADHINNKWLEKLNQYSAPGKDHAWEQMRVLLDKNLPVKRRKFWPYRLLLLMLLLCLICIYSSRRTSQKPLTEQKMDSSRNVTKAGQKNQSQSQGLKHNIRINELREIENQYKRPNPGSNKNERQYVSTRDKEQRSPLTLLKSRSTHGSSRKHPSSNSANRTIENNTSSHISEQNPLPSVSKKATGNTDLVPEVFDASVQDSDSLPTNGDIPEKELKGDSSAKLPVIYKDKPKDQNQDKSRFRLGLGFNHHFPLTEQKHSAINEKGGFNDWKDYLPVLVGRFYFKPKVRLQAEFQWHAPQYTSRPLIRKTVTAIPPNPSISSLARQENNIYVKKLYYSNLPVSIQFSPIKNIFIGGGIQYSKIGSAIALQENRILRPGFQDSLLSTMNAIMSPTTKREFLRSEELRFLLTGETNYKNFSLGMQYNWASRSYLKNGTIAGSGSFAANKSLLLFLRYEWGK